MSKVTLAIHVLSYNRPYHLALCLYYLRKALGHGLHATLEVDDQESSDVLVGEVIADNMDMIDNVSKSQTRFSTLTLDDRNKRVAHTRWWATEGFLQSDADYLLLLDDDILMGEETLMQAVWICGALKKHRLGAFTLHAGHPKYVYDRQIFVFRDVVIGKVRITGESALIIPRETLETVGNPFDFNHPKGFADVFWQKLKEEKLNYFCQVYPTLPVQHIGIGENGSTVYDDPENHFWTRDLWREVSPLDNSMEEGYIGLAGFDPEKFMCEVETTGGDKAVQQLCRRLNIGISRKEREQNVR